MVGAGTVVTQAFAGEGAQEYRARVFEHGLPPVRIVAADLQMLGRDAVTDGAGLFHTACVYQGTATTERTRDDVAPRQGGQQALHLSLHPVDISQVGAQQNALRKFIMFSLAEQVHGNPVRRSRSIGQHQNFARAGNHVDSHRAENPPFGGRHVGIARPRNLVYLGHGLRTKGQCRYRLGAAYGKDTRDAGNVGRGQHQRITLAGCVLASTGSRRGSWHHHDNLSDAGHMGRNGIHQDRGWISRLATRNIDADPVQRGNFLPQQAAVFVAVTPAFTAGLFLRLVEDANTLRREKQRVALRRRNTLKSQLQLLLRQFKRA